MKTSFISKVLCVSLMAWLAVSTVVQAGPYTGTPNPVFPMPGYGIPTPQQVTGKEYLDSPNKDALGNPSSQQIIAWDGVGGVMNSFNFMGTTPYTVNADALANNGDALFQAVIQNSAALLISATGDSALNSIWYESVFGGTGVWATKAEIDQHGVNDLDGLEVWGPDYNDDSNRFSLLGDPGGWAVWHYNPAGSVGMIQDSFIGAAIGLPESQLQYLDLDALMMYDNGDDYFAPGEQALISIRPISGFFDGGEIWVLDGNGSAVFLNHGGHLWNTAFNVQSAFCVANENIDALEAVAVPEPATFTLLGLALAALALFWRRRLLR